MPAREIHNSDFYQKINAKFKRFEIKTVKNTMEEICFPKKYELQAPQKFVDAYTSPNTNNKDLLVFHRIGSGKSCTGVRVGERWKKLRRIIWVLPAALRENIRNELRTPCAGNEYISDRDRERLKELLPDSIEYTKIIEKSDEKINRYYEIHSYNKFVELISSGELNLRNAVLIVDEIQNMVSEGGTYYKVLYDAIHSAPKNLRVLLLSATPMFDRPSEIALTLNLLRLPKPLPVGTEFDKLFIDRVVKRDGSVEYLPKNIDLFKKFIRGYVSYFRGAPPCVFPTMKIKVVRAPMEDFQFRNYITVSSAEEITTRKHKFKGEIEDLPNNFYIGTRMISNIAFPNLRINEKGWKSLDKRALDHLPMYSAKFARIMRRIKRSPGTVFVYSNFKEYGGIRSFVKVLEHFGYHDYVEDGPGAKRFAVWTGDVPGKVREEIRTVFNKPDNMDGSKIRIILGSPSIKEGVSFMGVRQVHLMEPYWNRSRVEQVIGRASRFCSHKLLPLEDRNVEVFMYVATHPEVHKTVDEYILDLSIKKDALIKTFERALKEAAVDCYLNRRINRYEDEPLKCEM